MKPLNKLILIMFLILFSIVPNLFSGIDLQDIVADVWSVSVMANGDVYAGYLKNAVKEGWGTYYWKKTGDKYVGNWKNNKMNGFGTYYHKDASIWFMGSWVGGKKSVSAVDDLKLKTFGLLYGNIKDGYGIYSWNSGNKYDGIWEDSKKNGIGTLMFSIGDFCTGKFEDNELNGTGAYIWTNGNVYVGDFKAGKKEGTGKAL